jgi:2-oxoglutarate ferredoxin oxidoreductase subunit delta
MTQKTVAKGRVEIKTDICKGCGLCVSVCPKNVLELDLNTINAKGYSPAVDVRKEDCIGCGNCGITCPDSVINVYREN